MYQTSTAKYRTIYLHNLSMCELSTCAAMLKNLRKEAASWLESHKQIKRVTKLQFFFVGTRSEILVMYKHSIVSFVHSFANI